MAQEEIEKSQISSRQTTPSMNSKAKVDLLRQHESLENWKSEKFLKVKELLGYYLGTEAFDRFDKIVREGDERMIAFWFVSQDTFNRCIDASPALEKEPDLRKQYKSLMKNSVGITFPDPVGFSVFAYVRSDYSDFVTAVGTAHERLHMAEKSRDADFANVEQMASYKARTEAEHRLDMRSFLRKVLLGVTPKNESGANSDEVEKILTKLNSDLKDPKAGKMKLKDNEGIKVWMPSDSSVDFMYSFLVSKGLITGSLKSHDRGPIGQLCLVIANEPNITTAYFEREYKKGRL